ncbi:hypothetical protein FQR65_LT04697 [Abscondita terminalis]|nr:hypothetical protein FQR65_LT04697 [Abscondita terminalis]
MGILVPVLYHQNSKLGWNESLADELREVFFLQGVENKQRIALADDGFGLSPRQAKGTREIFYKGPTATGFYEL